MKSFFSLSTLSAVCLFSGLAFGDAHVSRGSLKQELSLNTTSLLFSESFSNVTVLVKPGIDSISVSLNLVGESDNQIDTYQRNWGLSVSGTSVVSLSLTPTGGSASSSCVKIVNNGRYVKLKGVCVEGLEITVPEGMRPKVSSDKKMITLVEKSSATTESGEIISSRSVDQLVIALRRATFDSDKREVLLRFVKLQKESGSNPRLLVNDLVRIIKPLSFDDSKIDVIRSLAPFITERFEAYQAVVNLLSFSSAKQEAQSILLK